MPIAAIIAAATEAAKLALDIIEAHNNGLSQEELQAKWEKMQGHVRAANANWEAAGGPA